MTPVEEVTLERWRDAIVAILDARPEPVVLAGAPMAPSVTTVRTTPENFGRVPRVYIECARDAAISRGMQKQIYTALPCRVVSLDRAHSPSFSAPERLARLLAED